MKTKNAWLAVIVGFAVSGCVIYGGGGGQSRGDITVLWSFNGQGCFYVPSVQSIRITIPGQVLANNGVFPCMVANVAGVTLQNFRAGRYDLTLEGLDASGRTIYSGAASAVVNGSVTVSVDLQPTQAATGQVLASWTLPNNLPCAQVGDVASGRTVSRILVSVDGSQPSAVDCTRGNPTSQNPGAMVTVDHLAPGQHTFDLVGEDNTGFPFVRTVNSVTVQAGGAVAAAFQLNWVVGSLPLQWTFVNAGVTIDCSAAQVAAVYVNLRNQQTQRWVFADAQGNPTAGQPLPCVNPMTRLQGAVFGFLQAANYEVHIQAPVNGNTYTYRTSQQPPVVQIQAGVFAQQPTMGQTFALR